MIHHSSLKPNALQASQFALLFTCVLSLSSIFAQRALAETNASGVEIEVVADEVNSNLTGDPVQNFIGNLDSADNSQSDLWARIKDGYAMPDLESEYTANHEAWYSARPDYVKRMVQRSQKYLFHIVEEVQKRGMPTEIALLPMVESAFNPQAYSRSRASGIWQFVPSTGKDFGLKQTWWVDNRRDVTAATNAALTYLQKLHGMFGTWELALAAYNAGEGTVQRAIERNQRQGLPTDYQSLDLPVETKNYVPKLQAIKNIVTEPEKYGLKINSIPNQPYFTKVKAPKQIDAKLVAQLAEISYDEFSALNPSYNRPVITSNGEVHQFLLPTWAAERFSYNLENYNKPLSSWQTYQARRGERMDNIAKKFGINVNQFRNVNSLASTKKIDVSQPVLVPAAFSQRAMPIQESLAGTIPDEVQNNQKETEQNEQAQKTTQPAFYKARRGDTLVEIADKFDIDSKVLMKLNHLKSSQLKAGQVLKLSAAHPVTSKAVSKSISRSRIASKNSNRRLAANSKKPQTGRKLKIAKLKSNTKNARTRLS